MASPTPEHQRLFLALWPDEATRVALARFNREQLAKLGGRPVPADNFHLTVAFLGSVEAPQRDCLIQALDLSAITPFEFCLDSCGHWRRSAVAWMGASIVPEPLNELVRQSYRALLECGLPVEQRPWQAHLTLRRKVHGPPALPPAPKLCWSVIALDLVASQTLSTGAEYTTVYRWPLGPGKV